MHFSSFTGIHLSSCLFHSSSVYVCFIFYSVLFIFLHVSRCFALFLVCVYLLYVSSPPSFLFISVCASSLVFISLYFSACFYSNNCFFSETDQKKATADQIPHFLPTTQLLHQQKITLNFQCLRISPFSTSRKSI